MPLDAAAQELLRALAPQVLGILRRRYRDFAGCEDAVQEALIAATRQWPAEGMPDNPRGWLLRVATRRLADEVRADTARRLREQLVVSLVPPDDQIALAADAAPVDEADETLSLYFLCCHPALTAGSQVALTLRAVGGLTTAEIARAFFVPEATMAQRISRAKQAIRQSGLGFTEPGAAERRTRLAAVLRVLSVIFGEGYAASEGALPLRIDLTSEAIRVTRQLVAAVPDDSETAALLALMLLTDARRPARIGPLGELVPLDEQDRTAWNTDAIAEGNAWLESAIGLARGRPGPYVLQAAVAALHDEAPDIAATDWGQIRTLYGRLIDVADSPMARLSHAIATAMVEGPDAGLAALDDLARAPVLAGSHRLPAARAHLLERAGRPAEAADAYRAAAGGTASTAERTYLLLRAARLTA